MPVDITRIPQLARNLNRVAEITGILAKYGLAGWVAQLDSRFLKRWVPITAFEPLADATHEQRVRLAFTELGTTFIKLGQMLSTRRDLIGPALADELANLQSNVPADADDVVRGIVETELRRPLHELFATFAETPLASASIGQVHRATLHDGRTVAVKVQHPNILDRIHTDLSILAEMAQLAEEYLSDLRAYRPTAVIAEFHRLLLRELDFRRELRHLQIFRRNFHAEATIRFPEPIAEFSTSRVLTLEFLAGTPLTKIGTTLSTEDDRDALARNGAKAFLDMIFRDGFYHTDPHPGNILLLPGNVVGLLDAGMVGRVDDRLRGQIEAAMAAVIMGDAEAVADLVMQVGEVPPYFDVNLLQQEIAEQMEFYWGMPLDQFHLGNALDELTESIRRFEIALPPALALLLKVLIMLEGSARLLSPRFNLVEVLQPYRRGFLKRRVSPKRLLGRFLSAMRDWDEIASGLPRLVRDLMVFARRQQFAVQLEHQHLEPSVNRLVFGMMTSALFLGSALLWAMHAPPLLWGLPVAGVCGCGLAFLLGVRLYRAIQKSGRLEEK
ncbi:MAG: AarF/ABC1/UbiB kinase family protein [Bacteroidales bacterium]|nr:AarF/ABC1/UbiB kinase family protein [Bacteroidales bacterium]